MSASEAIEREVAAIRAMPGTADDRRGRRYRDLCLASLLRLLAPRVRQLTRRYGLLDHFEDAVQVCAIATLRALELYDPHRARFATFATWHMRGELQALRFRLRTDQRGRARKLGASTVSIDALGPGRDAALFVDEDAVARVEAGAAELLARRTVDAMLDGFAARRLGRPDRVERDRVVLRQHLLGGDDAAPIRDEQGGALAGERLRHVTRRALAALGAHVRGNPRFDPDAWAGAA